MSDFLLTLIASLISVFVMSAVSMWFVYRSMTPQRLNEGMMQTIYINSLESASLLREVNSTLSRQTEDSLAEMNIRLNALRWVIEQKDDNETTDGKVYRLPQAANFPLAIANENDVPLEVFTHDMKWIETIPPMTEAILEADRLDVPTKFGNAALHEQKKRWFSGTVTIAHVKKAEAEMAKETAERADSAREPLTVTLPTPGDSARQLHTADGEQKAGSILLNAEEKPVGLLLTPTKAKIERYGDDKPEADEKPADDQMVLTWAEYDRLHAACPVCGSVNLAETAKAFVSPPDTNRTHCWDCDWFGIVDDLKPTGYHPPRTCTVCRRISEPQTVDGKLVCGACKCELLDTPADFGKQFAAGQ